MTSLLDLYTRPAPVDVAGTAYQERSPLWELVAGAPQGPQVKDPATMGNDRWQFNSGGTAARESDLAWDQALASPTQRAVAGVMGSEPMSKLMMLANFLGPKAPMPTAKGVRAYHGSPHDFDKFDSRFIGTGEGAQAYGHGLYFAEKEGVARSYRDQLTRPFASDGSPSGDLVQHALKGASNDPTVAAQKLREHLAAYDAGPKPFADTSMNAAQRAAILDAIGRAENINPGRMYEVNIKADPADFLDWDVPISQQPQARAAVEQAGFVPYTVVDQAGKRLDLSRGMSKADAEAYAAAKGGRAIPKEDFDFDALRKAYRGKDAEISAALAEAGIPGIKYKDAGSRGAEGGTSNYAVFSDDLVDIVRKYGLAGLLAGGASLAAPSQGDAAP